MAALTRLLCVPVSFALLMTACGPMAATTPDIFPVVLTITDSPEPEQGLLATPPAEEATEELLSPAQSPTLEFTSTPNGPTPGDTLLPALELPTERPSAPALVPWTGLPTYRGDSEPGRLFRVDYDPEIWAQTEGNFGDIVLAHRQIDYCTITPWSGHGLPMNWKVEHEFRLIGEVPYDINTVIAPDEVKFVAYVGGDQLLLTGFQVSFQEQTEQCLQDAEIVFATLRSFVAQPTSTPNPSATP